MANCVINILSKNKIKVIFCKGIMWTVSYQVVLQVAHFKRLVIWKSFFLNFRRPLARRNDQMVLREHFADLEPPEWAEKDDDEESSKSTEPHEEPVMSLMEVEKIDYLADVVLQTFKKSDALGSSEVIATIVCFETRQPLIGIYKKILRAGLLCITALYLKTCAFFDHRLNRSLQSGSLDGP